MHCAGLLLCVLMTSLQISAQTAAPKAPPPASTPVGTIRATTQIVILDVNVMGPDGAAVKHLKAGDFTVLENGVPQRVDRFEEHAAPATGAKMPAIPRLPAGTYTNFSMVPEDGPLNIILLDTLNTPMDSQMMAKQKINTFLQTMKPNQHVAIFGLSTRLFLLQGFTSDPELLRAAINGKHGTPKTSPLLADPTEVAVSDQVADALGNDPNAAQVTANLQQFEAIISTEQLRDRVLTTLTALNQLARYLNGLSGRKNLIWMSGSFPLNVLPDPDLPNPFAAAISMEDSFRDTTNLLARSQVAVYPVDARGLFVAPMFSATVSGSQYGRNPTRFSKDLQTFSTNTIGEHNTMQAMADATGGKAYVNNNDLSGSVDSALHDGANYYTLVYSPTNHDWNGKYRKIVVRTTPGSTYALHYRRGYYADDPSRKTLEHDNTAATRPAGATIDPLSAAMQRGAPDPTQILFKARIVPAAGTADQPAEGTVALAKIKPPYRTFIIFLAGNAEDFEFHIQPDGNRLGAVRLAIVAYTPEGQPVTQFSRNAQAVVKPADYEQMLKTGVQFQEQISIPLKGEYFLRVGLKDAYSGKVGAIEVPVSAVPAVTVKSQ